MKIRFTPILLIFAIIVVAFLSRLIGNSEYIFAQTNTMLSYKFSYCPYNRAPYTNPNGPYRNAYTSPNRRFPYPYAYPLPHQYPCPPADPAVNKLLLDDK